MRIRLAPIIATSLASLLFLFSLCINSVFAQPGPGQGPRPGEVHLPSPPPPDQRNGAGLCPVVNIAMRFRDGSGPG